MANSIQFFGLAGILVPFRQWLSHIEIDSPQLALCLCKIIPMQCPFEREMKLWGDVIIRIPPLCKINPFYEELMQLRFRALCYLVDECGWKN